MRRAKSGMFIVVLLTLVMTLTLVTVAQSETNVGPENTPIIGIGYATLEAPFTYGRTVKEGCSNGFFVCLYSVVVKGPGKMLLNFGSRAVATSTVGWYGGYERKFGTDGELARNRILSGVTGGLTLGLIGAAYAGSGVLFATEEAVVLAFSGPIVGAVGGSYDMSVNGGQAYDPPVQVASY